MPGFGSIALCQQMLPKNQYTSQWMIDFLHDFDLIPAVMTSAGRTLDLQELKFVQEQLRDHFDYILRPRYFYAGDFDISFMIGVPVCVLFPKSLYRVQKSTILSLTSWWRISEHYDMIDEWRA